MENLDSSWSSLTKGQTDKLQMNSTSQDEQLTDSPSETSLEVKEEEIAPINDRETKIELTGDQIVRKNRQKKLIILGSIAALILAIGLYFILRPKETLLYSKHEEFGPCLTDKDQCFQDIFVYRSGKTVYNGKITKTTKLSAKKIKQIKQAIINSNLLDIDCKEPEILMEYKLTHTFSINGKTVTIKSPGCDNEIDSLDHSLDNILK